MTKLVCESMARIMRTLVWFMNSWRSVAFSLAAKGTYPESSRAAVAAWADTALRPKVSRRGHHIANPHPRESIDFRERPHDHDAGIVERTVDKGRICSGPAHKVMISLVN